MRFGYQGFPQVKQIAMTRIPSPASLRSATSPRKRGEVSMLMTSPRVGGEVAPSGAGEGRS